jgi:hypothetical protein
MLKDMTGIRESSRLLDRLSLDESSSHLAAEYERASPYPYLTIDNMFETALLDRLLAEMSEAESSKWIYHNTRECDKLGQKSAASLGDAGFELACLMHSAPFLYLLSEITGIWNLLPDPYMHGAGYSIIPSDGKFDVHVDLNADLTIGLTRRLVVIVYLNRNWKSEYGGQLELWNKDATRKVCAIEPVFNRTLIMEIADQNYHGIAPVVEPNGRSRYSFMLYFNTAGEILGKDAGVHSSLYAPACYRQKQTFSKIARRWLPPAIFDRLRHSK